MEHLQSALQIRFAQRSEAGRKPENQDTVGARLPDGAALTSKGIAIAIADGVSSSEAAHEASQTAITGFLTDYYANSEPKVTKYAQFKIATCLNSYLSCCGAPFFSMSLLTR